MSEPIISPLAVYLITRLDFIYATAWLIFCVSIMIVVASLADEHSLRECAMVVAFVGNGGTDKIIGVCDTDSATVSINCDDEIEYTEAEEID